jgi:hypothetical protein
MSQQIPEHLAVQQAAQASATMQYVGKSGKAYITLVSVETLALIAAAFAVLGSAGSQRDPSELRFVAVLSVYVTVGFFYFAFDSIVKENVFQFWYVLACMRIVLVYVLALLLRISMVC